MGLTLYSTTDRGIRNFCGYPPVPPRMRRKEDKEGITEAIFTRILIVSKIIRIFLNSTFLFTMIISISILFAPLSLRAFRMQKIT